MVTLHTQVQYSGTHLCCVMSVNTKKMHACMYAPTPTHNHSPTHPPIPTHIHQIRLEVGKLFQEKSAYVKITLQRYDCIFNNDMLSINSILAASF